MSIVAALLDLLGFERHRLTCELIERLRPGAGHVYAVRCDPPACIHCGSIRSAFYRKGEGGSERRDSRHCHRHATHRHLV